MPIDYMHANHLASASTSQFRGFSPQFKNNAILYIALNDPTASETLVLSLDSFPVPKATSSKLEMKYMNETRSVAGAVTLEDLTVQYKDFVDTNTSQILWAWRRLVYNHSTGGIGLPAEYKRNGWVELRSSNNDPRYTRYMDLEGIYPLVDPDHGEFGMETNELAKLGMSLAIDKAYPGDGFLSALQV